MKRIKQTLATLAAATMLGGFVASVTPQVIAPVQTVEAATEVVTINYVPGYGIAVWNKPTSDRKAIAGKKLKHGTSWKVLKTQTVDGKLWYNLGGDQWIDGDYAKPGYPQVTQAPTPNTYPWGQCTWYVKNRAPWAGNWWGNGNMWGNSARAKGFTVNNTPAAGAIVSFAAGQMVGNWMADRNYGHVAYVESYNAKTNTMVISQGGLGFSSPTGPNYQTIYGASRYVFIHR